MKKRSPTQRACLDEEALYRKFRARLKKEEAEEEEKERKAAIEDEEALYRKFRARLKKEEAEEEEKERKAAIEWDIEFETRPRGNGYISTRENEDPGRDWDDR